LLAKWKMKIFNINTNATANAMVAKAIRKSESLNSDILCTCICNMLEDTYKDEELEKKLEEIGMSTTNDIKSTINNYIKYRYTKEVNGKTTLTKEVKNIFKLAIEKTGTNNKAKISAEVVKILSVTFSEESLEYKSVKLGLSSSTQILNMLNLYYYDINDKEKTYRNVCSLLF